ncbi:hypothetical protein C8Q76DRAFT_697124 [Earliella scabrosa]|nr:hypothetical protein C8Q76DRAFT_697124 [Earliella scabrosa]
MATFSNVVSGRDVPSSLNGMPSSYRWDDSDDSDVPVLTEEISPQTSPELIPAESPPTGPQRRQGVTALEQYMALVVDGRRIFFQVIVSVEEQGRGTLVPHVQVVWADRSPPMRMYVMWRWRDQIGSSDTVERNSGSLPNGAEFAQDMRCSMGLVEYLDLAALVSLRNTCHRMYALAASATRASVEVMLSGMVGDGPQFLDAMFSHRAVIGGEAALTFLLEDRLRPPPRLQLFAPWSWYPPYIDRVHDLLSPHIVRVTTIAGLSSAERATEECTVFTLNNTRAIVVWRSSTISALSLIASAPCSALMNFVTAESFGCGYPALTYRRHALLADESTLRPLPFDCEMLNWLHAQRFTIVWNYANLSVGPPIGHGACVTQDVHFHVAPDPPQIVWPATYHDGIVYSVEFHEVVGAPRRFRFYPYPDLWIEESCFREMHLCPRGEAGSTGGPSNSSSQLAKHQNNYKNIKFNPFDMLQSLKGMML